MEFARAGRWPALAATALTLVLTAGPSAFVPVPLGAPATAAADDEPTPLERQHFHHLEAEAKAQRLSSLRKAPRKLSADHQLYDALRYELELDLDPPTQTLQGRVTCVAEVVGAGLDTLTLDLFDDMAVSAVEVDEVAASFEHAADRLRVDLGSTRSVGDTLRVTVDYAGSTVPQGAFQWDSYGGQDMIWTLSEPFGARHWWPCKDVNTDKPDGMDIRVTVPDELIVASNGLLQSDTDNAPRAPSTGGPGTRSSPTSCPWPSIRTTSTATGTRPRPAATPWRSPSTSFPPTWTTCRPPTR